VKDWVATGKLPPRDPAKMTARMLLEEVTLGEHATCSVVSWGVANSRAIWFKCSCENAAICTVENNDENKRILQNVPREE